MRLIAFAGVATLALIAAACSSGDAGQPDPAASSAQLTQSAEAGGVTVEATWLTGDNADSVKADLSKYPSTEFVVLDIKLDTHSGDLKSIDMERAAGLEQGGAAATPEAWIGVNDDSHHRQGILVFRRELKDGPVTLTVDLGGKQVQLLWGTQP